MRHDGPRHNLGSAGSAPAPGRGRRSLLSVAAVAALLLLTACADDALPEAEPADPDVDVLAGDEEVEPAPDATEDDDADDAADADDADGADEVAEDEPPPLPPLAGLTTEVVADGFTEPVGVATEPGTGRLVVLQRTGLALLVEPDGQRVETPFADLRDQLTANSIEQGLLGLAFHPSWPTDDRVFAYHSLPGNDNVLVSYRSAGAPHDAIDPTTRDELLRVPKQPDLVRHNGGHLEFAPDGLLYVAVGDGARASVNGQDPSTVLGAILRLDVDGGEPYAIPPDNPFADGTDGAAEVFWYGLRNPWRFSIDATTGLALIADVGQETIEEVNVVPFDEGGHNFGWPIREGTRDFYGGGDDVELTDPVLEITHDEPDLGCSVTGGVVSRDPQLPEFDDRYWYADWCRGWIRSALLDGTALVDIEDHSEDLAFANVASFGVDGDGAVLVVDWGSGELRRIVGTR
jgi:glucose/arabinose dehydrogenase